MSAVSLELRSTWIIADLGSLGNYKHQQGQQRLVILANSEIYSKRFNQTMVKRH